MLVPPKFNKQKLAQATLITKTDFDNKMSSLNGKIFSNKTKDIAIENKLQKFKIFDLSYFIGKLF